MSLDGKEPVGGIGSALMIVILILGIGLVFFIMGRIGAGFEYLAKNHFILTILIISILTFGVIKFIGKSKK